LALVNCTTPLKHSLASYFAIKVVASPGSIDLRASIARLVRHMAPAAAGERTLKETATWAVALVCAVFVIISILIEHGIHSLEKVRKTFIEHFIDHDNVYWFSSVFPLDYDSGFRSATRRQCLRL
jgi:hypothetical protein